MPEGPEICREADEIGEALTGQEIARLRFALPRLKSMERRLAGAMVRSVDPHGKALANRRPAARPSLLAGSGNYLRSEILFDAKLHPLRCADSLTPVERRRFARTAIRIGIRA